MTTAGSPADDDPITSLLRYGLSRSIQLHSEEFRVKFPAIVLDLDLIEDENLLPEAVSRLLFRVYIETLHNVERHVLAEHAAGQPGQSPCRVSVRYFIAGHPAGAAAEAALEITATGSGFSIPADWAKYASSQSGVMGMKTRIEAAGGRLHIATGPGESTQIAVSMPLSAFRE